MKCPDSVEELQELEKLIPLCKVTLYEQAQARIKSGAAKSEREASRQIGDETGRKPEVIRSAINREKKERMVALLPDLTESEKKTIVQAGRSIQSEKREIKQKEIVSNLESIETKEAKKIEGTYDVIVIDPPWPMEKIERDERPNQSHFDYPTMNESELSQIKIPATKDCHLWQWTTQKYLPMALRLLEAWKFKYICTFVWHKPGGFQPFGLPQYNCEFVLYARKGSPKFIDTKAFSVCFNAPRGKHSEKPNEFYETVRRVTAGRRLDMFSRRKIDGFDGWGKESE